MGKQRCCRGLILGCKNDLDVDTAMKSFSFVIFFTVTGCSYAGPLLIFDSKLELNANCTLSVTQPKGKMEKIYFFEKESSKNCRFINHSQTNIPHAERIGNFYVLLIETLAENKERCIAKYTAIAVANNGIVYPSSVTKTSGTCNIGRERKVFEYFAHKMQLLEIK